MAKIIVSSDTHLAIEDATLKTLPLKPEEYYHLIRAHLDAENNLLGQKINWLVGSEAFLYMAYISLLNAPEKSKLPFLADQLVVFMWLTPISALGIAFCAYAGMLSSNAYLNKLVQMWEAYPKNDAVKSLPPIHGKRLLRILSMAATLIMPLVFIASWIIALIYQILYM